jgi:hypothetical protein
LLYFISLLPFFFFSLSISADVIIISQKCEKTGESVKICNLIKQK